MHSILQTYRHLRGPRLQGNKTAHCLLQIEGREEAADTERLEQLSKSSSTWHGRRALLRLSIALSSVILGPSSALAETKDSTRLIYQQAAEKYDDLDNGFLALTLGFQKLRKEVLRSASGDVLEVAVGTGLNLPLYPRHQILRYIGLDLSPEMLEQAEGKLSQVPWEGDKASLVQGDVEALPFADASFDTVVSTYSLCVFPNPLSSLKEIRRVLKPHGQLLLLEHSRSSFAPLALYQDVTADAVAAMSKGCVWNQDVVGLVKGAGFEVTYSELHSAGLITLVRGRA